MTNITIHDQLELARAEKAELEQSIEEARLKLSKLCDEINRLYLSSKEYTPDIISDHAVLRYMERHQGIDVDELKRQIVNGREGTIRYIKNGKIKVNDITFVIKNSVVVTII